MIKETQLNIENGYPISAPHHSIVGDLSPFGGGGVSPVKFKLQQPHNDQVSIDIGEIDGQMYKHQRGSV